MQNMASNFLINFRKSNDLYTVNDCGVEKSCSKISKSSSPTASLSDRSSIIDIDTIDLCDPNYKNPHQLNHHYHHHQHQQQQQQQLLHHHHRREFFGPKFDDFSLKQKIIESSGYRMEKGNEGSMSHYQQNRRKGSTGQNNKKMNNSKSLLLSSSISTNYASSISSESSNFDDFDSRPDSDGSSSSSADGDDMNESSALPSSSPSSSSSSFKSSSTSGASLSMERSISTDHENDRHGSMMMGSHQKLNAAFVSDEDDVVGDGEDKNNIDSTSVNYSKNIDDHQRQERFNNLKNFTSPVDDHHHHQQQQQQQQQNRKKSSQVIDVKQQQQKKTTLSDGGGDLNIEPAQITSNKIDIKHNHSVPMKQSDIIKKKILLNRQTSKQSSKSLMIEKLNNNDRTTAKINDIENLIIEKTSTTMKKIDQSKPKQSDGIINGFISLFINSKRCLVTINPNSLTYEPELMMSNDFVNSATTITTKNNSSHNGQSPSSSSSSWFNNNNNNEGQDGQEMIDPSEKRPFVVKIFHAINDPKKGFQLRMLTISDFDLIDYRRHFGSQSSSFTSSNNNQQTKSFFEFYCKIQDTLELFDRPKRLLFFINPFGGSNNAIKIFDSKIKPILHLARIGFNVVITERANHAKDILLDRATDLHSFDGIVCVGGDGMFGEILNGVLIRYQQDNQIDYDEVDVTLVKPSLKLGVIPAGSTDAIVYATCGHKNPTNSIISVVLGLKIEIDVGAVHNRDEEHLIRYTASFMGYGFFGDTVVESERSRWMGIKRYDWAGIKKFFNHQLYSGEIKLCIEPSDGSPKDSSPCSPNCFVCLKAGKKSRQVLNADDSPACISIRGRFLAINSAIVSCRCRMSKYGMSPMAHVGNGCTDLILVSKCSRFNYFRYLLSLAFTKKSPSDFDFVDSYRVREFEFNPIIEPHKRSGYAFEKSIDLDFFDSFDTKNAINNNDPSSNKQQWKTNNKTNSKKRRSSIKNRSKSLSSSVWNCDGEIVNEAAIHVKIHCQLVTLYAPGFDVHRLISGDGKR